MSGERMTAERLEQIRQLPVLFPEQEYVFLGELLRELDATRKERDIALAELELERRKDHAYRSFTNGYERAMEDYAAGRTAGWPTKVDQ